MKATPAVASPRKTAGTKYPVAAFMLLTGEKIWRAINQTERVIPRAICQIR